MRSVHQLILKMQFTFAMAAPIIAVHEPSHPLRPDARRHLARTVLPARMAARGRRDARRGADRRHRRVRPAAGRRRRRRQHADQQGRDRLEVVASRAATSTTCSRRSASARSRSTRGPTAATCCRASARSRSSRAWSRRRTARRRCACSTSTPRSRIDVTVRTPGRRVTYDGDDAHRRRGRHGGADPPELPRRLGRGHRLASFPPASASTSIDGIEVTCIDAAMPL